MLPLPSPVCSTSERRTIASLFPSIRPFGDRGLPILYSNTHFKYEDTSADEKLSLHQAARPVSEIMIE